jgi:hypothetical protein
VITRWSKGWQVFVATVQRHEYALAVRKLKTSIVVSTAMLAASHAFATLQVAPTRNPEAAEVQAQETLKLAISGMT